MRAKQIIGRSIHSIIENATAGSTSAASVAVSVGGEPKSGAIGVGFNPDGDAGIYAGKPKKAKASPVLRR